MLRSGCLLVALLLVLAPRARAQAAEAHAARELARGTALGPDDIATDSGTVSASALPLGWITRRVIHVGEPLRAPAISPPQLVRAGTNVTVRAVTQGIIVSREGIAQSGGVLGEQVRVRLDTRRTITGTVAGPANVQIP